MRFQLGQQVDAPSPKKHTENRGDIVYMGATGDILM